MDLEAVSHYEPKEAAPVSGIRLSAQEVLAYIFRRRTTRSLAKRPADGHRALAAELAKSSVPRFAMLPWWEHPNPKTGEHPAGIAATNRHARRAWYRTHRKRSSYPSKLARRIMRGRGD